MTVSVVTMEHELCRLVLWRCQQIQANVTDQAIWDIQEELERYDYTFQPGAANKSRHGARSESRCWGVEDDGGPDFSGKVSMDTLCWRRFSRRGSKLRLRQGWRKRTSGVRIMDLERTSASYRVYYERRHYDHSCVGFEFGIRWHLVISN